MVARNLQLREWREARGGPRHMKENPVQRTTAWLLTRDSLNRLGDEWKVAVPG